MKTLLVCGYGTGISDAVVRRFAAEGFTVGIAARSAEKLAAAKRTLAVDFIEEVPRMREGRSRPAQLYRIKAGRTHVVFPRRFYV